MVEEQLVTRGIADQRVLEAMGSVPRHEFVPEGLISQAYNDHPLNIGQRQTISQPYIVALMTTALALRGDEKVLEVGTGSGYQTAVLAQLCRSVCSIERIASLAINARQTLFRLGILNLSLKIGDGTLGWTEEAPFDRILVTAATPEVPPALTGQMKEGGRLVIPLGNETSQELSLFFKASKGLRRQSLGGCRFVKLIGEFGFPAHDH